LTRTFKFFASFLEASLRAIRKSWLSKALEKCQAIDARKIFPWLTLFGKKKKLAGN
jgi:hypothetical protein